MASLEMTSKYSDFVAYAFDYIISIFQIALAVPFKCWQMTQPRWQCLHVTLSNAHLAVIKPHTKFQRYLKLTDV